MEPTVSKSIEYKKYLIGGLIGFIIGAVLIGALADGRHQKKNQAHDDRYHSVEGHDHDTDIVIGDLREILPDVSVAPISHASAVIVWDHTLIFADPVGDAAAYTEYGYPDVIFITHRHGDHFDTDNLPAMFGPSTLLIAPQDVIDQLPEGFVPETLAIAAGERVEVADVTFEAVPAYNVRTDAQNFHPQSRGDVGYIISDASSRVYFSGDSEGTSEMQALEDIDAAFVAMNLPYTMDVDAAAEAVLAFAPKKVFPYHFRTPDGFSDVERFKELVNDANKDIEVVLWDWYKDDEETGE